MTLFSHVGRFHDLVNSMGPQKNLIISFIIHTFRLNSENLVESYSWHYAQKLLLITCLCIHMKHGPSWYYSLMILLIIIVALSSTIPTLFTIFYCTNWYYSLFVSTPVSKILSMKVRYWRHVLNATYRMKHKYATH